MDTDNSRLIQTEQKLIKSEIACYGLALVVAGLDNYGLSDDHITAAAQFAEVDIETIRGAIRNSHEIVQFHKKKGK